eukprot:scaffold26121_cov19-Tisochrysis_lutea.AAC.1
MACLKASDCACCKVSTVCRSGGPKGWVWAELALKAEGLSAAFPQLTHFCWSGVACTQMWLVAKWYMGVRVYCTK